MTEKRRLYKTQDIMINKKLRLCGVLTAMKSTACDY